MYYIGIDQSYTSTGMVIINDDGLVELINIKTNKSDNIFIRAIDIGNAIVDKIDEYHPDCLIGIEGLAFSMKGNATRDLAGLQFVIVSKIYEKFGILIDIISPLSLKKFATGNGRANKNDMVESLPNDILNIFLKNGFKKSKGLYDITDAYYIALYLKEKYNK
jgi:Holliday junction resolvasome RuvABC endonuclease subunit